MINKKNLFMYFVAFVASLGGFQFGYEVGILASIKSFESFKIVFNNLYDKKLVSQEGSDYFEFKYEENKFANALLGSVFGIGCMIGALVVPTISDFFGRKRSIIFGAVIFGIGSLFSGIISALYLFYATRIIMGIGIGILSTVCPMYIAEAAPATSRGALITLYQFMITIGILLAYVFKNIINSFLKYDEAIVWRVVLGNQIVPGFLLLIMVFFLPYSPRYYIWQERDEEALRIVSKLRGFSTTRDPEIRTEFQNMKRSLDIEKHEYSTSFKELFKKNIFKRVIMVMGLQILQQFTGINFILNNHMDIFKEIFPSDDDITTTLSYVNMVINVIGTIPAFYLIEKFGRKTLLIIGSIGMTISLAASSFCDMKKISLNKTDSSVIGETKDDTLVFSYISACGILLFILFFASSWGPAIWVYQSEAFPMRVRSKATALCSLANWTSFAVIGTVYPVVVKSADNNKNDDKGVDVYFANAFFAICCLISFFYVVFFVKETRGVSLEDMDKVFGKKKSKRN